MADINTIKLSHQKWCQTNIFYCTNKWWQRLQSRYRNCQNVLFQHKLFPSSPTDFSDLQASYGKACHWLCTTLCYTQFMDFSKLWGCKDSTHIYFCGKCAYIILPGKFPSFFSLVMLLLSCLYAEL